jgi:glycosyltransferase involved in cell wall biosynthesis
MPSSFGHSNMETLESNPIIPRRPIRVAMLSYSFYELDGRVTRYAESLVRCGDHVDVIAIGRPGSEDYVQLNGVHVYRVQHRERNEKGRVAYLGRILKFFFKSSIFLNKMQRKHPYDVIHVHSVPDFEVFAAWRPKLGRTKIILDIHDIVPEFYIAKFGVSHTSFYYKTLILAERLSTAFADHVIISNHLWEKTLHRSVGPEKCSVILNYPDDDLFFPREKQRNDGKCVLMYPGTMNWHQGLDVAVKAIAEIKNESPRFEFHIYGIGESKKSLNDLSRDLGLVDRVFFHDMLPKEDIAKVMARVDIGVVPKRNDSFGGEAFSTKILEFMALGIPLIVSKTKIDQFYFNDSVVKFFEPGNEKDLAEKILALINNQEERQRLAANGLKFVEAYKWGNNKHLYLDLVNRLVN